MVLIKSHIGFRGSEAAEPLATAGAELDVTSVHVGLPQSVVKHCVNQEFLMICLDRWEEENLGRSVNDTLLKASERHTWTFPLINCPITGHGPFPSYYRHFRIKPLARLCLFCSSTRPVFSRHILVECVGTQPLSDR